MSCFLYSPSLAFPRFYLNSFSRVVAVWVLRCIRTHIFFIVFENFCHVLVKFRQIPAISGIRPRARLSHTHTHTHTHSQTHTSSAQGCSSCNLFIASITFNSLPSVFLSVSVCAQVNFRVWWNPPESVHPAVFITKRSEILFFCAGILGA